MNRELPDVQAGFRKGRGTRDQLANICQITQKAREFQEISTPAFLAPLKPLAVWINKLWKILKEMGIPSTWPSSREIWLHVKKQQLELDMEQQTGFKRGKGYEKAVYCHTAYLTFMQNTVQFCLLRNLYAGQEATVRTGHGTTDWFQTGKGVHQGCILSPCLFKYAEYIMRNAGLEEAWAGIKTAGRNINKLRYADDTTLWQKVKRN